MLHRYPNCVYNSSSCVKLEVGFYKYSFIHDIGEHLKIKLRVLRKYIFYFKNLFFNCVERDVSFGLNVQ